MWKAPFGYDAMAMLNLIEDIDILNFRILCQYWRGVSNNTRITMICKYPSERSWLISISMQKLQTTF